MLHHTDNANEGELFVEMESEIPAIFVTGKGNSLYLAGWCFHTHQKIESLTIQINDDSYEVTIQKIVRPDLLDRFYPTIDPRGHSLHSGFWATVTVPACESTYDTDIVLLARLHNRQFAQKSVARISIQPEIQTEISKPLWQATPENAGPMVAIAMATYNPPLNHFRQQVESLQGQSWRNWMCVIRDDCSSPELLAGMREIIGNDHRFFLSVGSERLGFYRNFEQCLTLIPDRADFVALCDQDDYWYPDKLESLLSRFKAGTTLVYSDLKVTDREGRVIEDTYWRFRRNNFTDLASLLMINTVPGAATMIRRELLKYVLPFPPQIGPIFHDQWIAVMALTIGKLEWVDRPLYNWTQHSVNVIGFNEQSQLFLTGVPAYLYSHLTTKPGREQMRQIYFDHVLRISMVAQVALVRGGSLIDSKNRRALKLLSKLNNSILSLIWLILHGLKSWQRVSVTNRAEYHILLGVLWRYFISVKSFFTTFHHQEPGLSNLTKSD